MSIFQRNATVAYDGKNFSILSIESISSAVPEPINPTDLHTVFAYALNSSGSNSSDNTVQADSVLFNLGWISRLYEDYFPENKLGPQTLLQGFLAIPIQFGTTALQYINATHSNEGNTFALSPSLETTASSADSVYRALAAPWTVYLYISLVLLSVTWSIFLFLLLIFGNTSAIPNLSNFPEIDIASKMTVFQYVHGISESSALVPVQDYSVMLRNSFLGNADSAAIIEVIRNQRIRVAEMEDLGTGVKFVVLVTSTNSDIWGDDLKCLKREYQYV
jgi:hypothetical protein